MGGPLLGARLGAGGQWHDVVFIHDGASHGRIYLDGALAMERWDMDGPIRDISAYGLAMGHWPDPDPRYTLDGYLDEVLIWRDDPAAETLGLLDPCCMDREGLDQLLDRLRAEGATASDFDASVASLLDLRAEINGRVRNGDATRGQRSAALTTWGMVAATAGDEAAFTNVIGAIQAFALEVMPMADLQDFGQRTLDILRSSPLGAVLPPEAGGHPAREGEPPNAISDLARLLCLDRLTHRHPGREHERPHDEPASDPGDPHTDRPIVDDEHDPALAWEPPYPDDGDPADDPGGHP